VAEAGVEDEQLLIAAIEFQHANKNRIVNVAGAYEVDRLKDRRPEVYARISQVRDSSSVQAQVAGRSDK
jgi:hypothetical protein